MKKLTKLIDNATASEDVDKMLKEFVDEKYNNEFRHSFEKKLEVHRGRSNSGARIVSLPNRKSIMIWASIAASFLLLVLFATMRPDGDSVRSLSSKYLDEMIIAHPGVSRSISNVDLNRSKAVTAFVEKDYQSANNYFSAIEDPTIEDEFFMGLSSLYLAEYDNAIDKFKNTRTNPIYNQESTFLLGLSFILDGNTIAAKEILKDISPGDYKYEESLSLIEKL